MSTYGTALPLGPAGVSPSLTGPPPPARSARDPQVVRDRRRARQEQIRTLRLRATALVLCLFLAVWVVLFLRLTSGHDPALASVAAKTSSSATVSSATSGSATSSSSAGGPSGSSGSGSVSSSASPQTPSAVQTNQS